MNLVSTLTWLRLLSFGTLLSVCLSTMIAVFLTARHKIRHTASLTPKTSEELELSLSLLQATLEATDDGIVVVNGEGRITSFNRKYLDLWGIPPQLVVSNDTWPVVYFVCNQLKDSEAFILRTRDILSKPNVESHDVVEAHDGRVVEIYTNPKRIGSRIVGRVWSFRDITKRKLAERTVAEQQFRITASSKMTELGQMAVSIAHEINNPLTVIQIEADSLADLIQENNYNPQDQLKGIQLIQTTCSRISKIIKGLRSFARDGHQDPYEEAKIQAIVDETLEYCREKLKTQNIKLNVKPIPALLTIECQSVQISQVILNLLNNACDAIEKLPHRWITLDVSDCAEHIEIAITDSGSGIPPEIREKILQPFFTTKDAGKGTGLGLSISKKIIENHQGEFKIDAQCPNTRFVLIVPKKRNIEQTKAA